MFGVVFCFIFHKFLAFRIGNADHAIVEVDKVVLIDSSHVISAMCEGVCQDQVNIFLIGENDVVKYFEAEKGEINILLADFNNFIAFFSFHPNSVEFVSGNNIVINAHGWERIRALEYHANFSPQHDG